MRPKKWKAITREDLPDKKEIPEWLDAVLDPINNAMRELTEMANNKILIEENNQCEVRTIDASDDTAYSLKLTKVENPKLVVLGLSYNNDYCKLKWRKLNANEIEVTVKWDTPPSEAQTVTLFIIGG